jgi:thiol-disulfide isomerase/thioredoxin
VVVALGVIPSLLGQGANGVEFSGDLREGGQIEELSMPTLEGGGRIDYEQFAGDPLVINFYASWCPFCIAEMPAFETVHKNFAGDISFLGISEADSLQASRDLVAETGVTYPSGAVLDSDLRIEGFGSFGMPTTVLVGPGGEVVEVWTGPLTEGALEQLIAQNFYNQ